MKTDHFFSDANWKKVQKWTKLQVPFKVDPDTNVSFPELQINHNLKTVNGLNYKLMAELEK